MQKIIFIRTAPYSYKLNGKNLYGSLDEIGLQIVQPHISNLSIELKKKVASILQKYQPNKVFCSEFTRSKETALLFSKTPIIVSQLNEIKFSMNNFSRPEELPTDNLEPERINKIRHRFSLALLNNSLCEKQEEIKQRISDFKKTLFEFGSESTILCCSHGFIMKLYENSFNSSTTDFSSLVNMHDWKKPPFRFLDGFVIVN
ncbi:histidine phosphatase family protein [Candidatus Parcubacteria bacterium]|nr:histidine phosphatase family protein [Candidatus Parcubacteria bacterium]